MIKKYSFTDIGPRTLPGKPTCLGCPALKTEDWREPQYDDRGTYATCMASGGEKGKAMSSYWNERHAPPNWCPAGPRK